MSTAIKSSGLLCGKPPNAGELRGSGYTILEIKFGASSHVGMIRKNNEDYFAADPARSLFVVCDGMGGQAAGVLERVHFAVEDGIALLHAAVVAAAEDDALADQHAADRDAAFGKTRSGFRDGSLKEGVHGVSFLRSAAVRHARHSAC